MVVGTEDITVCNEVRLHVMTLAGISEMLVTLNAQEMVDVEPPRRRATSPDSAMANVHAHSIC